MEPIAFSQPFYGREEEEAAAATVRSRWVVGGPRLAEFESRFAVLCEKRHAVGVSSWTTGAFLVLKAWGIGPGDEVIVPSLTFIASVNVIAHVGASPVFVDVDPRTWNLDPEDVERKLSPRTKAIIAVDQLGMPCEIERIQAIAQSRDIRVLQDTACAFGSAYNDRPVGALAAVAVFSLHARKVISTAEGGMIVTDDDAFAERLRRVRHQGMSLSDYARSTADPTLFETYPEIGYNARITDIQAAIGLAQLSRLKAMLGRRLQIAERYCEALQKHPWLHDPHVPANAKPNWQSFQIRVDATAPMTRNEVMAALYKRGIPTRRGVMASHLEAPHRANACCLPHTETAAAQCLQLPMHPGITDEQVEFILSNLQELAHA